MKTVSDNPLLSIVIANYNYGRFLEDAIRSVVTQDGFDACELIIVDGGSTDNSVNVIKRYEKHISWWCSERDRGQSHAFNKGFSHATGRFLTWLNADDVMFPGVVRKLQIATKKYPQCEWFTGGCFWLDPSLRIVNCGRSRSFSEIRYRCGEVNVNGPSSFFAARLLQRVGGVNEQLVYTMDSDLWFRFARAGVRFVPFCSYAWGLRMHPDAKMSGQHFASDGSMIKNDDEQENTRANQRRIVILKKEQQIRQGDMPIRRMNVLQRLMSVSWRAVFLSRLDLIRYGGHFYMDYFAMVGGASHKLERGVKA